MQFWILYMQTQLTTKSAIEEQNNIFRFRIVQYQALVFVTN